MDQFTEDQLKEAKAFTEFYITLMENSKNLVKYYMSEDVVLDWFGHTVKGQKCVNMFMKGNLASVKHYFSDAQPAQKIGFRDTHIVKTPKASKKLPMSLLSPPRISQQKTPRKQLRSSDRNRTEASTSAISSDKAQSDSVSGTNGADTPMSPAKKFRPSDFESDHEIMEGESESSRVNLKYMTAEGHVEFHRPSLKKLQTETKWKRPCKLNVAYSSTGKSISDDCTIYLIIYEGNVKCRRNLLKEFEAEEPEN